MARKRRNTPKIVSFEDGIAEIHERKGFDINKISLSESAKLKTAIYARLSMEDNGYDDGDSIEMQVSYIRKYIIENPRYELVDIYIDNGYSGTNFERPEFKRMISDVFSERINCVIVKDLSRFGRNHLKVGIYIENIFPRLNARLVSINDNFDSSREEDRNSLSIPIKNMVNEMYARDISKKIKAANKVRINNRDSKLRSCPPYGYKLNKESGKLVPDERYAPYVRLIFHWLLLDVPVLEIAERLTLIGAPVPGAVTGKKNVNEFESVWYDSKIYNIMKNPIYTGSTVFNRYHVDKICGFSRITDSDEWVVHEDTHEALIPKEDFMMIKEKRMDYKGNNNNTKKKSSNSNLIPDVYKGLVFCGKCNHVMSYERVSVNGVKTPYTHTYYRCSPKDYHETSCGLKVYGDFVKMVVDEQLKIQIKLLSDKATILKKLKVDYNDKNIVLSMDKKIQAEELKLAESEQHNTKLYEDFSSGILDIDDYKLLKEKQSEKDAKTKIVLDELYKKRDEFIRNINRLLNMYETFKDKDEETFDYDFIHEMVEKIIVSSEDRIEVVFKFADLYDKITEMLESE